MRGRRNFPLAAKGEEFLRVETHVTTFSAATALFRGIRTAGSALFHTKRRRTSGQELRGCATGGRRPRKDAAQRADRRARIPGRPSRIHELAGRAKGLAAELRAVQSVLSHDGYLRERAGRTSIAFRSGREQLQGIRT